jgi:glycerophosphoryl diester phosphodiesterase
MKTFIATHRGLDPQRANFPWSESSSEAFQDHLKRGFWVEFDLQLSPHSYFYVSHHQLPTPVSDYSTKGVTLAGAATKVLTLDGMCTLLRHFNGKGVLHLKHFLQREEILQLLVEHLKNNKDLINSLLVFDATLESGVFLKNHFPDLPLAQSVSHEYDVERFNSCVGGTLTSLNEALKNRSVFEWIWFDEWDRADRNGQEKTLYNSSNFEKAREYGFKIAVVSPELHASSPGLLGNERHPDGCDANRNSSRMIEILKDGVDLICTDYPDQALSLIQQDLS